MAQYSVNQSNVGQFIETGKGEEYKAPDAKADAKPEVKAKADKIEEKVAAKAAEVVEGVEPEDVELPEKARRAIGKKHRAMKEAQEAQAEADDFAAVQYREAQLAKKEAAELKERLKALESTKAAPAEDSEEPKPKDFTEAEEYGKAMKEYGAKGALKAQEEETAKQEEARLNEERVARNKAFAAEHPDYEEVVASLAERDLMSPPHMTRYLMKSKASAPIMYYFAKNPEAFESIAQMEPIECIAALGELKATLAAKPAKAEEKEPEPAKDAKVTSKAPAPIAPLNGNQGTVHKELKDMNTRETIEYWEARNKATGERRQRH